MTGAHVVPVYVVGGRNVSDKDGGQKAKKKKNGGMSARKRAFRRS